MSTTATPAATAVDAVSLLSVAREARQTADAAEVRILVAAVDWAVANPPAFARDSAAYAVTEGPEGSTVRLPLNGDGVPEVDRAAVAELGLALGCSTHAAQALVGDALELAYRLPMLWTRVVAGEVAAWRARRVAQATRVLPKVGAGYVDRQVAPLAHTLGTAALQRLVDLAMTKHDQNRAMQVAEQRRESRGFDIDLENTSLSGLTSVSGRLDLPDALNLDAALGHAAQQLAAWGSTESLDVRRAQALGDLARQHLTWNGQPAPTTWRRADLIRGGRGDDRDSADPSDSDDYDGHGDGEGASGVGGDIDCDADGGLVVGAGGVLDGTGLTDTTSEAGVAGPLWRVPPRQQVVLYLHLTDAAFTDLLARDHDRGCDQGRGGAGPQWFGRVENTGIPVTAETIRGVSDGLCKRSGP